MASLSAALFSVRTALIGCVTNPTFFAPACCNSTIALHDAAISDGLDLALTSTARVGSLRIAALGEFKQSLGRESLLGIAEIQVQDDPAIDAQQQRLQVLGRSVPPRPSAGRP
jgi:hypothetical protein